MGWNVSTQDDYNVWRAHFEKRAGNGGLPTSAEPLPTAAPEPATEFLWMTAAIALLLCRRAAHENKVGQGVTVLHATKDVF